MNRALSAFIKKAAAFAAALTMMTCVLPGVNTNTVYAADGEYVFNSFTFTENQKKAMTVIKNGLEKRSEKIDLTEYKLTDAQLEDVYTYVLHNTPKLWYVSINSYRQQYDEKQIYTLIPQYNFSASEQKNIQKKLDDFSEKLLSGIKDSWSDAEKVLYVHDYIALSTEYGYDRDEDGRSIYETLIKGRAVCVGYALSFRYYMDELGIPCRNVISTDHIWNMVKIGGKWYHVDVTWDDTTPDYKGKVSHNMLLKSDSAIRRTEPSHGKWYFGEAADSSRYDNYFWNDSYAEIINIGGKWYYSSVDGIYSYSFETGKSARNVKLDKQWLAGGNKVWTVSFASLVRSGNSFYYNTPNTIYKYDTETQKNAKVKKFDLGSDQIFSIYSDKGVLKCAVADDFLDGVDKIVKYGSIIKLTAPDSISAKRSDGKVTVSWSTVSGADSYAVYRYDAETGKAVRIATTSKNKITFKMTSKDKKTKYAVKAICGDKTSGFSDWTA